jgi:tetratricopeptide (TPR) repeat protein
VREDRPQDAAAALRKAFNVCNENIKALERLSEVLTLGDEGPAVAARAMAEAAFYYERAGQNGDAKRCRMRAEQLQPGSVAAFANAPPPSAPTGPPTLERAPERSTTPEPGLRSGLEEPPQRATLPASRLETTDQARDRVARAADSAQLETDGPPRFVPPSEDHYESLEVERHPPAPRPGSANETEKPSAPRTADAHARDGSEEPVVEEILQDSGPGLPSSIEGVERMLTLAQTEFRAGNRTSAAQILVRAAQAYEALDRFENAATIYRSLSKGPHASPATMELWFANCESRGDKREAAQVACEIGDRAIQDNDLDRARAWFERALERDANSTVANRRLERLGRSVEPAAAAPEAVAPPPRPAAPRAPAAPPAPVPAAPSLDTEDGKVEVAVGRGQAVTFDFASMLAEFQRGVETQLSGDAQGHYDLAMAYREMGLVQQAIESFRLASKDVNFRQRCAEMIGHCLLAEGRFEEATHELSEALADASLSPESAIGIRFQLGLAYEAAGRPHEALTEFERVFEIQANYPEVAQKIRGLRKDLEAA